MLVRFLKRGSLDAFNLVYRLYARRLINYVACATQSKEDAEEIVHDIFMSLWKKHEELDEDTNIATFLFSIAYRRRIDFFRQSLNAPVYEDYMLFQNELISEDRNQLEYRDFCNLLNKALDALPPKVKNLLILSRLKGMTNEEIASHLQISEKTVRNNISIGLKLLKEQLDILGSNLSL